MTTAPYRAVDPRVWDDEKFLGLSKDGKLLWLHLLTGPQSSAVPGLLIAGVGTLADGLRESSEVVRVTLGEILTAGMAEVDEARRVIRLPKAPIYNPCGSPNALKGWFSRWQSIPDCALKLRHVESLKAAVPFAMKGIEATWGSTFGGVHIPPYLAPSDGLPKPLRTQDRNRTGQDQEVAGPVEPVDSVEKRAAPPDRGEKRQEAKAPIPPAAAANGHALPDAIEGILELASKRRERVPGEDDGDEAPR